jgi:parallel beta-helix repeat protein
MFVRNLFGRLWQKPVRRVPCRRSSSTRPMLESLEDRMLLSTYQVTNVNDSGSGSLRQAILNANQHAGQDTITFNIAGSGVHTIVLRSALPTITGAVVINGATQHGYAGTPLIELDGASAGSGVDGLQVSAGSSTVRGLTINRFSDAQIKLDTKGGDVVAGNFLGTDSTGTHDFTTGGTGVLISNSNNDRIGGTTSRDRNLIVGFSNGNNNADGVSVNNSTGTVIEGNFIGTDLTGTHAIDSTQPTQFVGIAISGGSGNQIGTSTASARNIISNSFYGVALGSSVKNKLVDNFIGTDVTGTKSLGNYGGVTLQWSSSNNTLTGNVISGSLFYEGIDLSYDSDSNVVQSNLIGVDATGTHALGNGGCGISILNSSYNLIGGTSPGQGNVLSGNILAGLTIEATVLQGNYSASIENKVEGNFIGTDRTGTLNLGNGGDGVYLYSGNIGQGDPVNNSYGNEIGGSAPWLNGSWGSVPSGYGNIIAFNGGGGVSQSGARMFNNPIRGNSIHDNAGLPISVPGQPFTPSVSYVNAGATTTVYSSVSSSAPQELLLDFYASNPSEFGQGRRYLGSTVVQASDFNNGVASFTANVGATQPGELVTVTATGYYGNTTTVDAGKPAWGSFLYGYSLNVVATGHEADGRMVLVETDAGNAVYVQTEMNPNSEVFGSPQSLGGWMSSVRVATDASGLVVIVGIGSNGGLWVNTEQGASTGFFGGWFYEGGSALQQIEVANDAAGLPVVFARGGDNAVYYQWENSPGSWSGWYGLGGNIQSISVGMDYGGKLVVAALGWDNSLYINTQSFPNSVAFNGWQGLGGTNLQQLALTNDASDRLTIYALGGDHAVYYQQEDTSDNWSGSWTDLYGYVQSITANRDAYGRMEVAAVGFDDQVYTLRQSAANGGWNNWSVGYGGTVYPGTAILARETNGTLLAFAEFNDIDISTWGYVQL